MAINTRAIYFYNANRQLTKRGSLTYNDGTDKYTYSASEPNINKDQIGTVQLAVALPLGTFSGGTPFITVKTTKGYLTAPLVMSAAEWDIIVDTVETEYQVFYLTLGIVSTTFVAGVNAFMAGYLGNGVFTPLDGSTYTVHDGVGVYEELDADKYEEIYTLIQANFVDLAGRLTQAESDIHDLEDDASLIHGQIEDIIDGTTVVEKAKRDQNGNIIDITYATKAEDSLKIPLTYLDTDGALTANSDVKIATQKATKTYADTKVAKTGGNTITGNQEINGNVEINGVLSMEGEKITNLAAGTNNTDAVNKGQMDTKVSTDIGTHNTSSVAHESIRLLIEALEQQIARLDGRGKSYGEIQYTTAEMLAFTDVQRAAAIKLHIEQTFSVQDYTPSNGELVYDTGVGAGVNYHEWEYNSTLSKWVDNGAINSPKASNTIFGTVKGNEYLSIVSGLVQVLKSDYATNLGASGSSIDYATLVSALSNRYTKTEVDALLDQLKAIYGWEDSDLGIIADDETILLTTANQYDFIVFQAYETVTNAISTQIVKPSDLVNGKELVFINGSVSKIGSINVFATDFGWYEASANASTCQVYGIKLTPLSASKVATSFTGTNHLDAEENVEDSLIALDTAIGNIEDGTTKLPYDETRSLNEAIADTEEDIEILKSKVNVIGLDYKEYGVREVVGQTSAVLQRVTRHFSELKIGSDTGLVANVALNDAAVTNTFDSVSIFNRTRETIIETGGVSNVFVKVPKYYIKEEWTTEDGINYHYWWMCAKKLNGYRLPLPFLRKNESEREFTYIGAYEAFLDGDTKLRSLSNVIPRVSYSRTSFRTAARKLDTNDANSRYQITDLAEYVDLIQIPMLIEFATKNMQSILYGFATGQYSATHLSLLAETDVNRVILTNAQAALYRVGQTIDIGTSLGGRQVAKDRVIVSITADTPAAGQSAIVFDGAPITTTTSQIVYNVAYKTGLTNVVVASSGFVTANDGKYPFTWRGIENPYGNIWKNVDGVKISNQKAWISTDPSQYNDTASVGGEYAFPYQSLNYVNAIVNGYTQELGYDIRFPFAKFTINASGGSSTFYSDYYYQAAGDRTAFVGGSWYDGVIAGPFFWALNHSLGLSLVNFGARLSYRP